MVWLRVVGKWLDIPFATWQVFAFLYKMAITSPCVRYKSLQREMEQPPRAHHMHAHVRAQVKMTPITQYRIEPEDRHIHEGHEHHRRPHVPHAPECRSRKYHVAE